MPASNTVTPKKSVPPPRPIGVRHLRAKFTRLAQKRSVQSLADRIARSTERMNLLQERYNKSVKRLEAFENKYPEAGANSQQMDAFVAYLQGLGDTMPSEEDFGRDAEKWEAVANVREYSQLTEKIVKGSKKRVLLWNLG